MTQDNKKVIIPKFVADWIEVCEKNSLLKAPLFEERLFKFIKNYDHSFELIQWIKKEENQKLFERAWLDGYDIEKEMLYTVQIPNPHHDGITALERIAGDIVMSQMDSISADWRKEQDYQLTEAEIKKDFIWAWQWAKPVEE